MIDLHVHILPGLDDGVGDYEGALLMAKVAAADGISHLGATPHVVTGLYENSRDRILEETARLNDILEENEVKVKVVPGAEYRLEPDLPNRLAKGELLTLGESGRYLLVELPTRLIPPFTDRVLYDLQLQGIIPVIAHPERNKGFLREPGLLRELVGRGILSQITSGSLTGMFGREAKRAALQFVGEGLGHFLASDAHSSVGRIPVLSLAVQEAKRNWGAEFAQQLVEDNPRALLKGQGIEIIKPREVKTRGLLGRFISGC